MTITEFSIKNSRLTLFVIFLIVVFGLNTYFSHPSQEDPTVLIREAVVVTQFPGMPPARIENFITKKIDEKAREIPQVKSITSYSRTGISIVHVRIKDKYFNLAPIWQNLRNKMLDVKSELPKGTIGPVVNDEFGQVFSATIMLTSKGFSQAEMETTAEKIRDEIYSVPGIQKVELHGVQKERIYLEASNSNLAQYGLTPFNLIKAIQQQNIILSGGILRVSGQNIVLEPSGNFESLDQIRRVNIKLPNSNHVVELGDILKVTRGYADPPEKPVYFNGQQGIAITVSNVEGENIVKFGDRLKEKILQIEKQLPLGYQLHFATFQPKLVEDSIYDFMKNLNLTIIVVLAVVMIFLTIRAGLIAGIMVPLSLLLTFIVMREFDISLHRISIVSMIIALGLLVDNGIVMTEDIRRRIDEGCDRKLAAIHAGKELALPLLSSTLTTILAFLPLMLAQDIAGEYTRSISQVILITLLGSWFLALYVTPYLSYRFLQSSTHDERSKQGSIIKIQAVYKNLLNRVFVFRFSFLGIIALLFVGAILLFLVVPRQFFPNSDRDQFLIYLDLPTGTNVIKTEKEIQKLSAWLADKQVNQDLTSNIAYVGYGGVRFFLSLAPFDPEPNKGFILVNTVKNANIDQLIMKTRRYVHANYPDLRAKIKKLWLGGTETGSVEIRLFGPNAKKLNHYANVIENALRKTPYTYDVDNNWGVKTYKILVKIDQAKARRADLSSEEIANSLFSFVNGYPVSTYRDKDHIIPIIIRSLPEERYNLDKLRTMHVYPEEGKSVPLLQIASFDPVSQYSQFARYNLKRNITISAVNIKLGALKTVNEIMPTLNKISAAGYSYELGGELDASSNARHSLFAYFPLCLALIIFILIWQFKSYRMVFIILLTIPLAFIGAVLGLIIMRAYFGFMEMLGILSLAGIIINNSIVLIDRINIEIKSGLALKEAIVTACLVRLRPILITTLTTMVGLLPLLFFGGPLWYGMASVIIFGLAFGTLISLFAVPILYELFFFEKMKGE